jgi:hypothetical protein
MGQIITDFLRCFYGFWVSDNLEKWHADVTDGTDLSADRQVSRIFWFGM